MKHSAGPAQIFEGNALIADPIHRSALFTVPFPEKTVGGRPEATEKDLIDSAWVQRLRRIHQLQSARWVYPSAEHSRFQHSLGTMHVAGEFGRYLYPSLKSVCPDIPSINLVEELLRLAGLLHDVGHGPFGHFFDDNFLDRYKLNHEILGQRIITGELGPVIKAIRRSPSGPFAKGERLNPAQVAFLIKMPEGKDRTRQPKWLIFLRQLFSGIYTVDNLDYVQRDAYMTGFSLDIVNVSRLRFYSFFSAEGLTLHQAGISALSRFLNARLNLYANVYFHRTTRALDLHLQEIFRKSMEIILPHNPAENLGDYLACDEWQLFQTVRGWLKARDPRRRALAREWEKLNLREVKWKMSYSAEISVDQIHAGMGFTAAADYERLIRSYLPSSIRNKARIRVDLATQDPRPFNIMAEGEKRINVYNPATGMTSPEPLKDIYKFIPARVVHLRVFSLNHNYDREITKAAEQALATPHGGPETNI